MNRSHLPWVVLLLALGVAACAGTGEPVVGDGGAALEDAAVGDGDQTTTSEPAASPVATPSPSPAPTPTSTTSTPPSGPTFAEVCEGRESEAFIEVLTPSPGAVVGDPVTVEGCGNTFEATFRYEVATADGEVLVEDFGTMSCGSGCVGEFAVAVEVGTTGPVVLTVFATDAQDGSRRDVVEVPLTVE